MKINRFGRAVAALLLSLFGFVALVSPAWAFCGFYVAKADTSLYNQASQVIIARDGDRTVLTMANDYQGEVKDFALVVPVPVVLAEDQVHVGEPEIIERLDSFSAPRLVEYFDANPCALPPPAVRPAPMPRAAQSEALRGGVDEEADLGVTIESQFSVGEYDILILSARESEGLETWLRQNDYRLPENASRLLQPYIRDGLKFFVARVNLAEFEDSEFQRLRPLMMAYESSRFMLPIRLGTVNASEAQDLIVYLLSPRGQVELTNYRTVRIPSNQELPEFVEEEFADFYKAMFAESYEQAGKRAAFLEYAWDMAWCDPCAANPLTPEELRQAGVFWLNNPSQPNRPQPRIAPPQPGPQNVFITRLHVRYTRDRFPEDLRFQSTGNRENFQGRYAIRRPYRGEMECDAADRYRQQVRDRQTREAETLAQLTGWRLSDIRRKIDALPAAEEDRPWWRDLWNRSSALSRWFAGL